MALSSRFLSCLLALLLILPVVHAESLLELQSQIKDHEVEYVQRFSGHIVSEITDRSVLEAKVGSWHSSDTPDKKGVALRLVASFADRKILRRYDLRFSENGMLYSLYIADYIANNLHNGDYAPADTLYLTDEADQLEAAQKGLDAYLNKLFDGAAEELAAVEVSEVYTEPFYVVKDGKMETLSAGHVIFSLTLKKDCDWAKAGQTYGITWSLAYNELDAIWVHQ